MNISAVRRWLGGGLIGLAFWIAGTGLSFGQGAAVPGGGVGYNAVVARLLADFPAFSANVETALTNTADKSHILIPMRMSKRDTVIRMEVDFVKMKGSGVAMQGLAGIQNIGMARMVSLVSPQDRAMRVLFPDLKFHAQVALGEADLPDPAVKVTKRQQGKDTIQGQACVRQTVTMTSPGGQKNEATVWESAALQDFPVRILTRPEGSVMSMTFTDVKLGAPEAAMFEVPKDYRGFDSVSGLMQEAMTKAYAPAKK